MIPCPTRWLLALATAAALGASARAQELAPPERPGGESPESAALRQEAIGQFDLNDDGALTGDEVGRARAFLQALRGEVGDRMRQRGRGGDRPPRPGRGSQGDYAPPPLPELAPPQPGEPGPPPPPPRRDGRRGPMATFAQFDADGDGQLNRDEFLGFWNSLGDRPGRMGPPDGRRFGGDRGFDAPNRERGRDRDGERGRGRGGPPRDGAPGLDDAPPFEPGPTADRPPADESA